MMQIQHDLMTKKQVAAFLQCSNRQVEILTKKERLPQPVYLGPLSPRWRRDEILQRLSMPEVEQAESVEA